MSLLELPHDSLQAVAQFLSPPDVLQFLSTHSTLRRLDTTTPLFWESLTALHFGTSTSRPPPPPPPPCHGDHGRSAREDRHGHGTKDTADDSSTTTPTTTCASHPTHHGTPASAAAKQAYLRRAHASTLTARGVQWRHPVEGPLTPTAREGHMACRLGNYLCVTGGFTDDRAVYVQRIVDGTGGSAETSTTDTAAWQRLLPQGDVTPVWAYGCSFTPISDTSAIRYGGFRSGGYANETHVVAVLTLLDENHEGQEQQPGVTVRWTLPTCRHSDLFSEDDHHRYAPPPVEQARNASIARAYHSATVLHGRFLVVVGGMQARGSVLSPLLLDMKSWMWYTSGLTRSQLEPSGRHGCSLLPDLERNRLLLFGGGSGSDLLRSGRDNTEVWALDVKDGGRDTSNDTVLNWFPWTWKKIHDDQVSARDNDDNDDDHAPPGADEPWRLSYGERLALGRCHAGHVVGKDTAVFCFGSRNPTTNSVVGYRFDTDSFVRVSVQGPIPRGRFTFASVYLDELGLLYCHGGFSSQGGSGEISETCLLDVAPGISRIVSLGPDRRLPRSYEAVQEDNEIGTDDLSTIESNIMNTLINANPFDQAAMAMHLMVTLDNNTQVVIPQSFRRMLNGVARGEFVFRPQGHGLPFEDEDSSDEDYIGDDNESDDEALSD